MQIQAVTSTKDVAFRDELRANFRLGGPLALGEMGWMSTYIVDAVLIGRMSHSALSISASSLGNSIYYAIAFFAVYLLNGLEAYIAQAVGGGNRPETVRLLMQSMWIVLLGTPFVMLTSMAAVWLLPHLGTSADICAETGRYMSALIWSTAPLMLYMALRRFLQSLNRVLLVSASLITAGVVNWLFDWMLIYGHGGFHAMGVAGSGWATLGVRVWMLAIIVPGTVLAFRELHVWPTWAMLRPDAVRLKALLQVGWPSGLEFSLELGISTFMAVLCARLGATLLAAHQVTLDLDAFAFMVPAGLSYAAMIRVGQAAGRQQPVQVERAAKASFLLAIAYSLAAAVLFATFSHRLASFYSNDPQVVAAAVPLFSLCGLLLLGDAAFVIHASAFTGLGDTRTPLWVSVACNWGLGMSVAYLLAFPLGFGLRGMWIGRALASVSSGAMLTWLWRRRMQADNRAPTTETLPLLLSLHTR